MFQRAGRPVRPDGGALRTRGAASTNPEMDRKEVCLENRLEQSFGPESVLMVRTQIPLPHVVDVLCKG